MSAPGTAALLQGRGWTSPGTAEQGWVTGTGLPGRRVTPPAAPALHQLYFPQNKQSSSSGLPV